MISIVRSLRVLADPIRLRIIVLLEHAELSVAEMQEIFSMAQSRMSTHLAQLKQAGLVEDRRSGKNILYRVAHQIDVQLLELLRRGRTELAEAAQDRRALDLILAKRKDTTRQYFDALAGKFGREYLPGRSWQGLAETLLYLLQPMVIADLGAGEGTFTLLLARRAVKVIGVDNSTRMVEYASALAARHELHNVEFRLGDLEDPPLDPESCDLAFFSQSLHHAERPRQAVEAAHRILKPGGRIVILDLKKHAFEQARELYADRWLGFAEVELDGYLAAAGFHGSIVSVVHREEESPHFETILAIARK